MFQEAARRYQTLTVLTSLPSFAAASRSPDADPFRATMISALRRSRTGIVCVARSRSSASSRGEHRAKGGKGPASVGGWHHGAHSLWI